MYRQAERTARGVLSPLAKLDAIAADLVVSTSQHSLKPACHLHAREHPVPWVLELA
jgi:hypothetical protein